MDQDSEGGQGAVHPLSVRRPERSACRQRRSLAPAKNLSHLKKKLTNMGCDVLDPIEWYAERAA
jgi:hypothetical protein